MADAQTSTDKPALSEDRAADAGALPLQAAPLRRITAVHSADARYIEVAFAVADERGATHFHFRIDETPAFMHERLTCAGVETHFASAPDYMAGKRPSHDHCQYLDGRPCWHDGTSLWASEHWIPGFRRGGTEWVWRELELRHRETFYADARSDDDTRAADTASGSAAGRAGREAGPSSEQRSDPQPSPSPSGEQ